MTEKICRCDNCSWTGSEAELGRDLASTPDLDERLDPGSVVPAGECPECGAFAYYVEELEAAAGEVFKPKPTEEVYIHSMGKRLRLTAIATTDAAANAHMAKPGNEDAVIACFGRLVLMANKHDRGAA